jgi:hypothetical protein
MRPNTPLSERQPDLTVRGKRYQTAVDERGSAWMHTRQRLRLVTGNRQGAMNAPDSTKNVLLRT